MIAIPVAAGEAGLGVDTARLIGRPEGRPLTGQELEEATQELASRMRCPVCQGLSVADSPTDSAQSMKAEVREFLAAGYTPSQILDYFEGSYGEFIRLAPKPKGFNWAVWLAPLAALVLGGWLIVARMRRSAASGKPRGEAAAEDELTEYLARVRREVGG